MGIRFFALFYLFIAGCDPAVNSGGQDANVDASASLDLATVDQAVPADLAPMPDLAPITDLAVQPDLLAKLDYFPKAYGTGPSSEVARAAFAVPAINGGGYILVGTSRSFDFAGVGAGYPSIWVVKVDWRGDIVWQKDYAEAGREEEAFAAAPIITAGSLTGFYIGGVTRLVGESDSVGLVLKLGPTGDLIWSKSYDLDAIQALTVASDGDCVVATSKQSWDTAIVKLQASDGGVAWQLIGLGDNSGGWPTIPTAIERLHDGSFGIAAEGLFGGSGHSTFVVAQVSSTGAWLWAKKYNPTIFYNDTPHAITEVQHGSEYDLVVAGETTSFRHGDATPNDMWVLRVKETETTPGDLVWSRRYTQWNASRGYALAPTSDGNVLVAGVANGSGMASRFLALKLNFTNGTLGWGKLYASAGAQTDYSAIYAAVPAPADSILGAGFLLAGHTVDFSPPAMISGSYWAVRVADDGTIPTDCPSGLVVDVTPSSTDTTSSTPASAFSFDPSMNTITPTTRSIVAYSTATSLIGQCHVPY